MKLYLSKGSLETLEGRYVFLDNNFLSQLYENRDIQKEFIASLPPAYVFIDPFTEFEFLRDVFLPEQRELKEKFVDLDIFTPIGNRHETFISIQNNALLLSKIYAHKNIKGVDLGDLFLAARIMLSPSMHILITANRKHFPECLFDTLDIFNIVQNSDGGVVCYSVLEFNSQKFNECSISLQKIKRP